MGMKHNAIKTVILAVLVLTACAKEGAGLFKGNYSFKTSGTLELLRDGETALEIGLQPESGQMDIAATGDDKGSLLVTMNVIGGDVLVYRAVAEGRELSLEPSQRRISLTLPRENLLDPEGPGILDGTVETTVTVSGTAARYGDVVLFELSYEGDFEFDGGRYSITGGRLVCRAKMNEK